MRHLLGILALILAVGVTRVDVRAAGAITDVRVDNQFPEKLIFHATVAADSDLTRVEFHYTPLPDGTDATGVVEFSPGKTASVEFELKVNDPPRSYFPAGTTIRYSWVAEDSDGNTFNSQPVDFLFLDNRFEWTPIQTERLTLYYHSGSESYANELAQIGSDGLRNTGSLLNVTVPFPVRVFLYSDPEEMRPALQTRSASFSELVTTGGVRVSSDTVFVAKGFDDTADTLRHELAHVVTKVAGEGAFGDLPAWLDEGTAVYSQSEPGSGYSSAIEDAIASQNPLSLKAMEAASDVPGEVNLFYGQSWSTVQYLIDFHSPQRFAALFAEFKKGATVDDALKTVYGFDVTGLENEWRTHYGMPARGEATPTPTGSATQSPIVTLTPFTGGSNTPSPAQTTAAGTTTAVATAATDDSSSSGVLVALAAAGAGVILLLVVVGLFMRNRRTGS